MIWLYVVELLLTFLILYGFIPYYKLWKTGLIYPTPVWPFFGNMLSIYRHGLQGAQKLWANQVGKVYAVAQSYTVVIQISDPTVLKDILVKNFGSFVNRRKFPLRNSIFSKSIFITEDEEWKMGRKLILPTFTSHKIKSNMFPLMVKAAQQLSRHMRETIYDNKVQTLNNNKDRRTVTINTKDYFGCFTMDAIASTAFGLDLDSFQENNHQFVKNAIAVFDFEAISPIFALVGLFPILGEILSFFNYSITDPNSMLFFSNVVHESIERRKHNKIKRNDYLQLLIDANEAFKQHEKCVSKQNGNLPKNYSNSKSQSNFIDKQDQEGDMTMDMEDNKEEFDKRKESGTSNGLHKNAAVAGFSETEMISNALLFFIAGYESTANALSWISRVLAWYPEVQERVKEEIYQKIRFRHAHKLKGNDLGSNLFESDKEMLLLSYEDILDLKYLDCVIKEVLRLYPPITIFDRVASEDYVTEDPSNPKEKLRIRKGTIVEIPVYALHHDESFWHDSYTFDPSRFMEDKNSSDYQYHYMPFGCGPRNCVGLRFALLEIKVGLVVLFTSKIKFVPAPGDIYKDLTPENTKFRILGINFPRSGIKVGIELDEAVY